MSVLSMKKMKLAGKLGLVISVVLVVIFTLLISVTVLLTQTAIRRTIHAELGNQTQVNAAQIQKIFDDAAAISSEMQSYLADTYQNAQAIAEAGAENHFTSSIYGEPLKQVPFEMEIFLAGKAKSTVKNNPIISGVGAMFEKGLFAANIPEYSIYVDRLTPDLVEPYSTYDEYAQEEFYQNARAENSVRVTQPTEYEGRTIVTVSAPIQYRNTFMGAVATDIDISSFDRVKVDTSRYSSLYALILDDNFRVIYDSTSTKNVGRNLSEMTGADAVSQIQRQAASSGGKDFSVSLSIPGSKEKTAFFTRISAGSEEWWAVTALNTVEMNQTVYTITFWLILLSVAAFVLLIFIVVYTLKKMLRPIGQVVQAAEQISQGQFQIHLQTDTEDEIGVLTKTFDRTASMLSHIIGDISRVLDSIAGKELNVEVTAEYAGDLSQIKNSMISIIGNLNEVMSEIGQAAGQVSSGSDQVSSGAQALSQGATQQASSVEELAAAISEISQRVERTAEHAHQASEKSRETAAELETGKGQMMEMMTAMAEINDSSKEIGKIIKTIEDIAFQTNILALNAAVEAARAGAAGKGFSVVADEVRNLASKSGEAAKDTTALIEHSIQAVQNGVHIAENTAQSLERIVDSSEAAAGLVHEISKASREQAESITQVTAGVDQISSVVQTNSATAQESAAASQELSGQAQVLKTLVGEFHLKGSPMTEETRIQPHAPEIGGRTEWDSKY